MISSGPRLYTIAVQTDVLVPVDERQLVSLDAAEEWLGALRRRCPERARLATVVRRVPSRSPVHLFLPDGYLVTGDTEYSRLYLRLRRLRREAEGLGLRLAASEWSDELGLQRRRRSDHAV